MTCSFDSRWGWLGAMQWDAVRRMIWLETKEQMGCLK